MTATRRPKVLVEFRMEEIDQMLYVLDVYQRTGSYYDVRKHHDKRHNDIKSKLTSALNVYEARRRGELP